MGPQVLHPHPFLRGLGDLLTQLLPVGADHVLDVSADEVREDGMGQVDVILADEEQVELSVEAVLAVVVGDGGVETVIFVPGDGIIHVLFDGIRYVLPPGPNGWQRTPVRREGRPGLAVALPV